MYVEFENNGSQRKRVMKIQFWLSIHVGFVFPLSTLNNKILKYYSIIKKSSCEWVSQFTCNATRKKAECPSPGFYLELCIYVSFHVSLHGSCHILEKHYGRNVQF